MIAATFSLHCAVWVPYHHYTHIRVNTAVAKCNMNVSKYQSFSLHICALPVQRYYYYIRKGVQKRMLAPQPSEQLRAIQHLVPQQYLTSPYLSNLRDELLEEIDSDYEFSARKSIG